MNSTTMSMEKNVMKKKKKGKHIIKYTDANTPSIPTIRRSKCLHTNMKTVNTKFSIVAFCLLCLIQFFVISVLAFWSFGVCVSVYVQCIMNLFVFFLLLSFFPSFPLSLSFTPNMTEKSTLL